jgi:two-component SAPR family response regulator
MKKLIIHLTDNLDERNAVKTVIERTGHEYINIQEYSEILLALLKYDPCLIILDATLSNFKVRDMLNLLRGTDKFRKTPVVIIVNQNEKSFDYLRNFTSYEYVIRPISYQKIFSIVDKYIVT